VVLKKNHKEKYARLFQPIDTNDPLGHITHILEGKGVKAAGSQQSRVAITYTMRKTPLKYINQ